MREIKNITGIILAGGNSSRMGADKGLIYLNGQTFMKRIIDTIKPFVNEIIIVSGNTDYDSYQLKRVQDVIENAGPLGGLYSGLFHSNSENNLVLSCDIPMINHQVLELLFQEYDDNFDVIQLKSKDNSMPLIALYKKKCMYQCLEQLQNGERRLKVVVQKFNTKTITIETELEKFIENINTKDQLKALKYEIED